MNTTENAVELPASTLTRSQYKSYGPKPITGYGPGAAIWAHVRHDDECKNGHNTFAITGTVRVPRRKDIAAGGCLHEEITEAFPELVPFIKWHLTSTDGPIHYLSNAVYLAGDRDYNGKRKGEAYRFDLVLRWDNFPIEWRGSSKFLKWCADAGSKHVSECKVVAIAHGHDKTDYKFDPKYTLTTYNVERWHECPFDTQREALQFVEAANQGFTVDRVPVAWSEGKERELDKARHAAVWPEATDAELSVEPEELKVALNARLPALMTEFKAAVESLGFTY